MRLLAEISGHGYGHLAQSAEVLNVLTREQNIQLTVRMDAPYSLVQSRIDGPFEFLRGGSDFGMCMFSALAVDVETTAQRYAALHENWEREVETQANWLRQQKFDAVFANVSYLILAAARQANIPAVAMCSLNWADIYEPFCASYSGAEQILKQMREAYASARCFICPEPSMEMPGLPNILRVAPVARRVASCREALLARLDLADDTVLVLVAPGGIPTEIPVNLWPQEQGFFWILTWPVSVDRPDMVSFQDLQQDFSAILAASDVVLTKPGYGLVTESVCAGKPVVYTLRGDWPEEPLLHQWLAKSTPSEEVSQQQFFAGDVLTAIKKVLGQAPYPPVEANGARQAADLIVECLSDCD